jgi:hypothetical protein
MKANCYWPVGQIQTSMHAKYIATLHHTCTTSILGPLRTHHHPTERGNHRQLCYPATRSKGRQLLPCFIVQQCYKKPRAYATPRAYAYASLPHTAAVACHTNIHAANEPASCKLNAAVHTSCSDSACACTHASVRICSRAR